jgi:hypothetical protein
MLSIWSSLAELSPTAADSSTAVTGSYAKSDIMLPTFRPVQRSLRRRGRALGLAPDQAALAYPIHRDGARRPFDSRKPWPR